MKGFFGKLGSFLTGVRVWTVNILTILVLVYIVGVVVTAVRSMPQKVDPQGKVLILSPTGLILDQEVFPSSVNFPFAAPEENQIQSRDLQRLIRTAAEDDRLSGVLVDFSQASFSGASTALRIAAELDALKASGKPVVAFSESLGTASYLMAARAEKIFVHPSGALAISGLGGYRNYTRELTDKLKITLHNYSQGDYKSAVEGMTRNDMSAADKEQREALYGPIWDTLKNEMASARGVEPSVFQQMADTSPVVMLREAAYDNLALAEELGLIDGTYSFSQFREYMIERFGKDDSEDRETYPHITADAYFAQMGPEEQSASDAVSVVFVEGAIQTGDVGPGVAGSDDVAALLRKAHENDATKAVVLRVNSPGGSILASDTIREELAAAKRKGMPVVVSMGDVAASGGVWVSTPADKIYAEPTTITGSIGVAVVIPTVENALDYLGIHSDGVTTSKYAGWDLARPVDEQLDAFFAKWAGSAYERFISVVADSRDKDVEFIRSIAGGRVWLAPDALEHGLIDELGTLDDALAYAAEQASLDDYKVDYVVKKPSAAVLLLRELQKNLGVNFQVSTPSFMHRMEALMGELDALSQPRATAMCTVCMVELL